MNVNVEYSKFNSGIEKANIPVGEDEKFEIRVVEDEETPEINLLELKTVNTLSSEEIALKMTLEEAKQFNALLAQFLRQL